ncbi:undecaprenyl-diphosphatase [Cohnella sp. REN36]|uniref:undecaprenyl-diphosphatase n=1 Tax=Cohnella sp. REN36 TaxID=2887347 RepID=UPI001D134A5A|nr:undecaprenyl-diphosphatase [Cohnella sp. REN36]MCC3371496.1 undecaprenyl-diphosphatase [Cohnella sp. REN36]
MNETLFHFLNQFAGRFDSIDDLMAFCAQDIVWIQLLVMAGLWFTGKATNQKLVFYAGLSAAVALLIGSMVISPAVNHPRPFVVHDIHQLIPHAPDASFPSDHATLAFSLAFSVYFVRRKLGAALLGLALLTGIARVYVGVHYPGDILGAIALSWLVSYAVSRTNGRWDALPDGLIKAYRSLTAKLKFLPRP